MKRRPNSCGTGTLAKLSFAHPVALLCCLCAGCWTVREPVAPDVQVKHLPAGKEIRVQLAGFDALVTTYVSVFGYATISRMEDPRPCGYAWQHCNSGFGTTTVSTTEFVPKTVSTAVYRDKATDLLEHAGCVLQTADPQYRVEVRFDGPTDEPGDSWAMAGWSIFTLLTADYGAQDWTAKLKIHDVKTGKLVYEKDRLQRYEAVVWGPIPFFSPLGSDRTSNPVMQDWCLDKLTEVTVADALEFLAAAK